MNYTEKIHKNCKYCSTNTKGIGSPKCDLYSTEEFEVLCGFNRFINNAILASRIDCNHILDFKELWVLLKTYNTELMLNNINSVCFEEVFPEEKDFWKPELIIMKVMKE